MPQRPIMQKFSATPWIANEPVDGVPVKALIPQQVQVAFVGNGAGKRPVPLTPAAHDLLYGSTRDNARQFFRGVVDSAVSTGSIDALRGMSLSTDLKGFTTNLMMSNIEAGYLPDTTGANGRSQFFGTFLGVAKAAQGARAQNTGWLDVGPKVSSKITGIINQGASGVAHSDLDEVAIVLTHELQHAATPPGPKLKPHHVWLEEGVAETLAWWPGAARSTLLNITATVPKSWRDPDVFTAEPHTLPSAEYQAGHKSVQGLLGLAGIRPYRDDGSTDPASLSAARTVLQADHIERVPRNLARQMVKQHKLDPNLIDTLATKITAVNGRPEAVSSLEQWIRTQQRPAAQPQ